MTDFKKENLLLNRAECAAGEAVLQSMPPVLFVELTQNCNLNCVMCRSGMFYKEELNMSSELFDKIAAELFEHATIIDLRGYGESTILKNFTDIVIRTADSGAKIRLVTNALGLNQRGWRTLMSIDASVVVSVDACSIETMKNLGRGSFGKLVRSLKLGCTERDRCGLGQISFNTVVSSQNLEEITGIVHLASKFGVGRVTLFPVVCAESNPLHLDTKESEVSTYIAEAEETANRLGIELRLGASLTSSLVDELGLPNRCSHPWEYCYIDFAGNVGYCDHLIGHKKLMLGNLATSRFSSIWNGSEFQHLRKTHCATTKGGSKPMETSYSHCNWCYQRRYTDFEDETNPKLDSKIMSSVHCKSLFSGVSSHTSDSVFLRGRKLPHIKIVDEI